MNVYTINGQLHQLIKNTEPQKLLHRLVNDIDRQCDAGEIPLRLAVTRTGEQDWDYELDVIKVPDGKMTGQLSSIFSFRKRKFGRTNEFNIAFLVPTGIDCSIGGHAGDATPAARLLASVADNIILHPNVVNASDINEQPANCVYVEGSLIARLMMGEISLQKVRSNRILVVTEKRADSAWPVDQVINTANAANATLGTNCVKVVVLEKEISMAMTYAQSGRPNGNIEGLEELLNVLEKERGHYDAVALATKISPAINIEEQFHKYFEGEGPNPWGGVEATLTHTISSLFKVPAAHAPTMEDMALRMISVGQVDPRKAAEAISTSYMFCILKGLHQSPQVIPAAGIYDPSLISAEDVSCMVIPDHCIGIPTIAALLQGIPVIAVRNNTNLMQNDLAALGFETGKLFYADNYLEAAGLACALKEGIRPASVLRPLAKLPVQFVGSRNNHHVYAR